MLLPHANNIARLYCFVYRLMPRISTAWKHVQNGNRLAIIVAVIMSHKARAPLRVCVCVRLGRLV